MVQDNIKIIKGEDYAINGEKVLTVTRYSNGTIKLTDMQHNPKGLKKIQKLNNKEYLDKETGEIKEYTINEYKTSQSLANTLRNSKELSLNNFSNGDLFATTTYREIKSFPEVKIDTLNFTMDVRRYMKDVEIGYQIFFEKENNRIHAHMLLKRMDNKPLYIDNNTIQEIWGIDKGYTYTEQIEDIDEVISYVNKTDRQRRI